MRKVLLGGEGWRVRMVNLSV